MCNYLHMYPFTNRVKANTPSGIYSFPINLHTINQFFNAKFGPSEAQAFIELQRSPYKVDSPRNFEEAMLSHLGKALYEEFIYGYTMKQWGVDPACLPSSIAKRLTFRLSYNDNYYNKRYQGVPKESYTRLFEKIFYQDDVNLKLNCSYELQMSKDFDLVVYSGALDEFFHHQLGRLSYRTVYWKREVSSGIFQGNAVVNYTDIKTPYTRINEPIYFEPWKDPGNDKSLYFIEFSKQTTESDVPYYPMRLERDKQLLENYEKMAYSSANAASNRVLFHGRLGKYQYLDMDLVVEQSASLADQLEKEY